MPCEIERGPREGFGTIVAFIQENRFDHALGDAVLILQSRQIDAVEQEACLIGLNRWHAFRIAQERGRGL